MSLKVFTFYKTQSKPMPQMAPMNWVFLFMFFSFYYLISLVKVHFLKYD